MKRFAFKCIIFYIPILFFCTYGCFCTGELGRLNGVPYGEYRPIEYPSGSYKNIYRNIIGIDTTEILVIGDSYSHWPCNAWYQYYAQQVSSKNIRTLAHDVNFYNAPAVFFSLLNAGLLDSCKVVVVETAERHFIKRLLNYDSTAFLHVADDICSITDTTAIMSVPNTSEVTLSNLHHIANVSRYFLKLKESSILSAHLKYNAFSHSKYKSTLFYVSEELHNLEYARQDILEAKEKLMNLHKEALKHNIYLIVMVAAGSYDLYQNYIVDNPYPKDTTLNYFNDIDTNWFLNTNRIIKPYLSQGEKDITLLNDSHWSLKSAKIAGEKLGEMIKEVLNDE